MTTKADELFRNGEIAYFEYLTAIGEAANIRLAYADALHARNQALIQLQFLLAE